MFPLLHRLWNIALDFLFPRAAHIAELESLSLAGFRERTGRASGGAAHTVVLFAYGDPLVKAAIWELKYRGNKKIAGLLGELLHEELLAWLEEHLAFTQSEKPMLMPIPLSAKRRRERGFNQCELLIDAIAGAGGNGAFEIDKNTLIKIKDTQSQTKSENREARQKNLKGCFAVARPEKIQNKMIILIDDVATTGATIAEARQTLLDAGAKKVIAFAIAH